MYFFSEMDEFDVVDINFDANTYVISKNNFYNWLNLKKNNNCMTEGVLKTGDKMFVVRVDHYVKLTDFAKLLTNDFYSSNISFDKKLTKKEAENVLRHKLFFHGLYGEYEEGYFESSFEEGERYNAIYRDALEWVKKKYPYLKE